MKTELYDILGVKKTATKKEIKKAFRDKSKKLHPDVNSGDDKEFKKIKEAYDVLMNDEKRKMYDETGFVFNTKIEDEVKQGMVVLFNILINKIGVEKVKYVNIIEEFKNTLKREISMTKEVENNNKIRIKALEDIRKRIKSKDTVNVFEISLNQQLELMNGEMLKTKRKLEVIGMMKDKIKKYSFKKAKEKEGNWKFINDMLETRGTTIDHRRFKIKFNM